MADSAKFGLKEYKDSQAQSPALRIYEGVFSASAMLGESMTLDLIPGADIGVQAADVLAGGGITESRETQIRVAREYYERGQLGDWAGSTAVGDWYYRHFLR